MIEIEERRAENTGRVRVGTLVEVRGSEPGIPAFEAEAVDVSTRGMHLRTAYLPENGVPLVCRFEDSGREIVVEGRVAWRKEGSRGGEFGVEFTALDSGSVGALRELCESAGTGHELELPTGDSKASVGSRVRLHIDGLGSPMKARVREGGSEKVQVGSNLEFLKVGRRLQVEDLEAGGRRQAQIDGVSVAIDPETRVPQLVVQLRFSSNEDTTPEPSVTALQGGGASRGFKIPAAAVTTDLSGTAKDRKEIADKEQADADAAALRGTLGVAAANANEAAKTASAALARFSMRAAHGLGDLFKGAGRRVLDFSKKPEKQPPRRTTSPAPHAAKGGEGPRLRPQSQTESPTPDAAASKLRQIPRKKLMAGVGGAALLVSVLALALHHAPPATNAALQTANSVSVATIAPPSTGAPLSATPTLNDPVSTVANANVPLFGPTPMATMEPAPLAPSPGSALSVEAQEKADAKANATGAPVAAAPADEGFSDESSDSESEKASTKSSKGDEKSTKSEAVSWGHGKLHSPTIYRLRLDGPGGKLQGALVPTGFSVLVPGHKVMEQGASIAKRDNRIASVRTLNRTAGAEVAFHFRDGVPPYRVRLRRDYVEFLIGEGEGGKSKAGKAQAKPEAKVAGSGKSHKG